MSRGIFFALLAYGLFSCADALIKASGGSLSVFEVGFFASLFGVVPAALTKSSAERWQETLQFHNFRLLNLRGISGLLGSACVIYAFTHVPMADVYALAFLAPLLVVLISVVVLKEAIPRRRWPLLVLSFIGVLIVVRPGFRDLQLGHLAALACAFFTAFNTILLRSLAATENRLGIFAVVTAYSLTFNGLGMLITGFELPSLEQSGILMAIGTLGGLGHLTFISATRFVPANQIAPVQYTQMIWALALGAIFYAEFVDLPAIFGIAILAAAGILNILSDDHIDRLTRTRSRKGGLRHNPCVSGELQPAVRIVRKAGDLR